MPCQRRSTGRHGWRPVGWVFEIKGEFSAARSVRRDQLLVLVLLLLVLVAMMLWIWLKV
jgi:hypothetical protein